MRQSSLLFIVSVTIAAFIATTAVAQEYVPNQLLVSTKGTESESRLQEMNTSCGTRIERSFMVMTHRKIYTLQIIDGRSVADAIRCWEQFPEVDSAEPNDISTKPRK